ncbi:myelin protein zero-like protein 1 isoform X3 [Athene cunicularia]|nr:myelin protein zero-like protein 1 isoform X3 [Athene cunicularia]
MKTLKHAREQKQVMKLGAQEVYSSAFWSQSISSRGQHTRGDICGEWDRRKASMHIYICGSDQQRSICFLEFSTRGSCNSLQFFYYFNGKPYPGKDIPFKDRITWAGDLNKKDASISISNMQFRDNGTYICDVKNPPDIVVKPGEIRVRVVEKDSLPAFPIAMVAGIVIGTVTGLSPLISIVVCLVIRKNNSKKRYSGCSTSESLMSPVKQAPQKSPSDTEGLVNSVPARSHQGPVIYAQLDHSGGQHSDKINKSESVVYADIRKN